MPENPQKPVQIYSYTAGQVSNVRLVLDGLLAEICLCFKWIILVDSILK